MHEQTIRRLVKEIDPRFDCAVNMFDGMVDITQRSPLGRVSLFDRVHLSSLDRVFFEHMRRVVYININGDMARQVLESEERKERCKEAESEFRVKDIAKDMRKADLAGR